MSNREGPDFDIDGGDEVRYPAHRVGKDKADQELLINIKKATSPDETAPKQKHVRNCIIYTWDYHTSISFWSGLRVQPILSDEIQTFKALVTVHKVLQEGHPNTIKDAHGQTGWLRTCARTVATHGQRGYGSLIPTYVQFILAKLRFHRLHPGYNGLFEDEEYISLKDIDGPDRGYEIITDFMDLQDQILSFGGTVFAHFRYSGSNECRISSLVPLVKESRGIYLFITRMLRALYRRESSSLFEAVVATGTNDHEKLEPLRERFNVQHYSLRRFYYECSNLKYLTGLINVPKLGQEPPSLFDPGNALRLPAPPKSTTTLAASPVPSPDSAAVSEQVQMLEESEDQQAALRTQQEAEERQSLELEAQQQRESEDGDSGLDVEVPSGTPAPEFDYDEPPSPASSAHSLEDGSPPVGSSYVTSPSSDAPPTTSPPEACRPASPSNSQSQARVNTTNNGSSWMAAARRVKRAVAKPVVRKPTKQRKTKSKTAETNQSNKDTSRSEQSHADPKKAGPVQEPSDTSQPLPVQPGVHVTQEAGEATVAVGFRFKLPAWMLCQRPLTEDGTH